MALLDVDNLVMHYTTTEGPVKAVDGISFSLQEREVLGVVGESGCGKSSLASALLKLLPSNAIIRNGRIVLEGTDLVPMPDALVRSKIRWTKISVVPQGAMNGMNPIFKVGDQIAESITAHSDVSKSDAKVRTSELLKLVGIDPTRAGHYPHEFSGGMKQRAMIAMALSLSPKVLIADEPTTALDVIVQAGIIELLLSIRREFGTSIILISHDLALVAQMSDKVAIMYAGKIVEYGTSKNVYLDPLHPYTIGLENAFADIRKPKQRPVSIPGSPPDLIDPPVGCRFNPRCPFAKDICRTEEPQLNEVEEGHKVACHLWKEIKESRAK